MPPPAAPRPDPDAYAALVAAIERHVDAAAAAKPNPGARTFQRLNRPEYARSIHELLGLDVEAGNWLPLDTKSANFDNIADAQALSPTLLEAYLNAASAISRMAIGDRTASPIDTTYTAPIYTSQHPWDHVEGAPYGTRGGIVVDHVFPADAEYVFEVDLVSGSGSRFEDIDLSINGERVALIEYETGPAGGADGRGAVPMRTEPVLVKAGQHKVAATFVRRQEGPYEDLIRPHDWSFAGGGSGGPGITTLPHVKDFVIKGPYRPTGIAETPARQKIFSCRPTVPSEERPCARQIIARIGAEARADALGTRFAAQWLRLQDVEKVHPDPNFYPNFDDNLAEMMRRETTMFFNNLVREDRSVLDLFQADYTFVNERLARHYGIPGVAGDHFRRVQYPDDARRGLLGQGSVLVQTSLANRTSPVLRGKWVMEVLMGTPPPPPPPDVPPLDDTGEAKDGRMLTTRERMEIHRKNPTCNSCHRFMDPIGLALDNFDVTGKWRVRENGQPLDTRGDFYDGTPVTKPAELLAALMKRPEPLVRTFTENLLAYALGRRTEYFDQPTIRAIVKAASANDYRMSSFILGVIKSDAFLMKRVEVQTTTEDRQGR